MNDDKNKVGNLETLQSPDHLSFDESNIQDIPQTFFKPIEQVQNQQQELIQNYNESQGNVARASVPDLSEEVEDLERRLAKKKFMMPISLVVLIVIIINVMWFLGVEFLIKPKYEEYVKVSDEIKENYDELKRKVDAIIGE